MVHVPYKGAGPAMTDLLGGVVDIYITSPPSAAAHLKNGAVKGMAMAAPERHPMLPDIPTAAEAGVPTAWNWSPGMPSMRPPARRSSCRPAGRRLGEGGHRRAIASR